MLGMCEYVRLSLQKMKNFMSFASCARARNQQNAIELHPLVYTTSDNLLHFVTVLVTKI